MGLQIKRNKDNRVIKAICHRVADIPGGVTIATAELGGKALREATPIAKGNDGLYHVVKTAKVVTEASATATTIEIAKGSHFKVGDFIGNGTKAQAITAIDKTNAEKDVVTLTATLGVKITAGVVLVECSGTDKGAKYTATAITGSNYDVDQNDNLFVDAWIIAVVREANAPGVTDAIKTAINCVKYI